MPRFVVTATDGRTFDVNAPEGATQDDVLQYVQSQLGGGSTQPQEPQETAEDIFARLKPDRGFFGATGAGLSRGFSRMGSLIGDVLPALGASALGYDDYAKRQMEEAAAAEAELQRTNRTQFQSLSDVKGPGDWLPFLGETLGEQGANILTSIGTGGVGAVVAKGLAKKAAEKELAGLATQRLGDAAEKELVKRTAAAEGLAPEFAAVPAQMAAPARAAAATPEAVSGFLSTMPEYGAALQSAAGTGAIIGAGASGVAQNTGEIFQNIYEETKELAPTAAIVGGAFAGALDTVLPARLLSVFRQAPPTLKAEIIKKIAEAKGSPAGMAKLIGMGAAKNFGLEAATEGAQEAISIAAERFVGDAQGAWGAPEFDRIFEASVRGGVAGGAFGVVGGLGEGLRERSIARTEEERKAEEETAAKAKADAEARRADEAKRILEIPTELDAIRAEIEAAQASPDISTRVGKVKLDALMAQEQKLKDDLELFSTPEDKREELLKTRAGTAVGTTAAPAANKSLEQFTIADLFHQIGITTNDAKAALKEYNASKPASEKLEFRNDRNGYSFDIPATGENAEKFLKFVSGDVLKESHISSLKGADVDTRLKFAKRIDEVTGKAEGIQGHPTLTPESIEAAKTAKVSEALKTTNIDDMSRLITNTIGGIKPSDYPKEWYERLQNLRAKAETIGNGALITAIDQKIAKQLSNTFAYSPVRDLYGKPTAYSTQGYANAAELLKSVSENKTIAPHNFEIVAKNLGIEPDTLPADREGRVQAIQSAFDAKTAEYDDILGKANELIKNATTPDELKALGEENGALFNLGFRVRPKEKLSGIIPSNYNGQIRQTFSEAKKTVKPKTGVSKKTASPEEKAANEAASSANRATKALQTAAKNAILIKVKKAITSFTTENELKEYWDKFSKTPTMFDGDFQFENTDVILPDYKLGEQNHLEIKANLVSTYTKKLNEIQQKEENAKSGIPPEQVAEQNRLRQRQGLINSVEVGIGKVINPLIRKIKTTIYDTNPVINATTKVEELEGLWGDLTKDIPDKAKATNVSVEIYEEAVKQFKAKSEKIYVEILAAANIELTNAKRFAAIKAAADKAAADKAAADKAAAEAARQAAATGAGAPPAETRDEAPPADGKPPAESREDAITRIKNEIEALRIQTGARAGKRPATKSPTGIKWDALIAKLRELGVAENKLPPDDLGAKPKSPRGGNKGTVKSATEEEQKDADENVDVNVIASDDKINELKQVIDALKPNYSERISPQFWNEIYDWAKKATGGKITALEEQDLNDIITLVQNNHLGATIVKKEERKPRVKASEKQVAEDSAAGNYGTVRVRKAEVVSKRFEVGIGPKFLQDAIKGKSLIEAVKWVIDNGPTKYNGIANLIYGKLQRLEQFKGFTFDFNINDGSVALTETQRKELLTSHGLVFSFNNPKKYEIWLNGSGNLPFQHGMSFETLLHEALHAATIAHTQQNGADTRAIRNLYDQVKHEFEFRKPNLASYFNDMELNTLINGFKDVDEFIAYGLTNRTMQQFLDSIPFKNDKTKSLFDTFIEWVLSSLGFNPKNDSALKELVIQTRKILESNYKDTTQTVKSASLAPRKSAVLTAADLPYELRPPKTPVADAVSKAMSPRERLENSTSLAQDADKVYKKVFGRLDKWIDELPVWSQPMAKKVGDIIELVSRAVGKFILNLGSLDQLADVAKVVNPKLADAIRQLKSAVTNRDANVDVFRERIERFVLKARRMMNGYSPEIRNEFNNIVHESTIDQIDFDNKLQYADPANPKEMDATKRREWVALEARFSKLPSDVQSLYRELRDEYQTYSNQFVDLVKDVSDAVGALSTGNKTLLQLMKRRIYPYFPLYRKGDFWVRFSVKDPKTGEYVDSVMAFETPSERRRFIASLKGMDTAKLKSGEPDVQVFSRFSDVDINNLPPTSQFRNMIKLLKESGINDTILNQVFKAYLDMFPTNSVMQQFRKRKNTAGFGEDAIGNFADVGVRMALNVAQFGAATDIDAAMKAATEAAGSGTGSETEKAVMGSLTDRIKYLKSPMQKTAMGKIAAFAGKWSYRYFILGNISSALVNLTQPFLTTLPILGGRYGVGAAVNAMNEARKMYWRGGKDTNTDAVLPFGIPLADFTFGGDKANNLPERYKKLYKAAVLAGAIRRSTGQDLMDMRDKGVVDPDKSAYAVINRVETTLGWCFQNAERANREITLLAAFNLELDRLRRKGVPQAKAEEMATEGAILTVEEANGSAMTETGPQFFQEGFGRLIGTFKRFALSQIYLSYKLLTKALVGASKEERHIAAKQFAYMNGMAFVIAGSKGLPLFGAVNILSSLVAGLLSDDDEPFDLEEEILRGPGNWFLRGPLGSALNIDIGSRTGWADLVWKDDPKRLADLGYMTYAMELAGGPIMGVGKNIKSGIDLIMEGQVARGIETMSPAALRNLQKTARFATEGATNRNGVKLVDDPNAWNLAMSLIGFNRNDLADVYARNSIMKSIERKDNERRANLLDRYDLAGQAGDYDELREIRQEMREYSRTGLGRTHPLDEDAIAASAKQRATRRNQMEQTYGAYYGKPGSEKVRYLEERAGVE